MNRFLARELVNQMDITKLYSFEGKDGYMYNCPICGSGTGRNHTGALRIQPGKKIKCFAGDQSCFTEKGEDVLGALRILWNCSEDEVFNRTLGAEWQNSNSSLQANRKTEQPKAEPEKQITEKQAHEKWIEKTRSIIDSARKDIKNHPEAIEYLNSRGISEDSIARFALGYDAIQKAIVIPYNRSNTYYTMRHINDAVKPHYLKPSSKIEGYEGLNIAEPLFNQGVLKEPCPVFVVESALCAISIEQAVPTAMAVALCGCGSEKLFEAIGNEKNSKFLILCLDNDEAGQKAQKSLAERLKRDGISHIQRNIAGTYKDPNEALIADKGGLVQRIYEAIEDANQEKKAKKEEYINKRSNTEPLLNFLQKVQQSSEKAYTPTGIKSLDKMLDGGLYAGLYIIGAVSSLGKTTLCMQIMDNIAASGQDVLIFSLEMDKDELMSKSISRHTYRICEAAPAGSPYRMEYAKTCRGISDGSRYAGYNSIEKKLIIEAFKEYGRYSGKIFTEEGIGDIGVQEIRERIAEHISFTGNKPVVFIDYMQILSQYKDPEAPNRSFTDKQAVDKNVLELKRISRDFNIPVLSVSSLNRASYNEGTNMASFKESGAIEYSADVLIGLDYNGITESKLEELIEKNSEKAEKGNEIEIKCKILKQRAGARGTSCILDYFPMFNAFMEHGEEMGEPETKQTEFIDVTEDIDVPF